MEFTCEDFCHITFLALCPTSLKVVLQTLVTGVYTAFSCVDGYL